MSFRFFIFILCCGCSIKPLYNSPSEYIANNNIDVAVIAEREGQMLRRHLIDLFRDLQFSRRRYKLVVTLTSVEKPFAIASDGNAKRLKLSYCANVVLKNEKDVVFMKSVSVSRSSNISNAQGEVVFSLYDRSSNALLKELGYRIAESIKVFLSNEN